MTQTVTLEQVLTEGRKAYEENRLSAQGPTPACRYRDDSGNPCVVGAAMSDDTVADIEYVGKQACGFRQLIGAKLVQNDNFDEVQRINLIQEAHDEWTRCINRNKYSPSENAALLTRMAEQAFVRVLYEGTN